MTLVYEEVKKGDIQVSRGVDDHGEPAVILNLENVPDAYRVMYLGELVGYLEHSSLFGIHVFAERPNMTRHNLDMFLDKSIEMLIDHLESRS